MAEKPTRDDVLRRMLKTPPTPHDEQPKVRKPRSDVKRPSKRAADDKRK